MTDLSRQIDDISNQMKLYHKEVEQLNRDLELLHLDLSLLIGDDAADKPKYRMEFAVDYDIIHSFAFTNYKPDQLMANLSDEDFWKKLDDDRLFCFFLLRVFRDKLVLLPPHGWEMEYKRRNFSKEYGKFRSWFKEENLPQSLRALGDDEDKNSEVVAILEACASGSDICLEKITVLLNFVKDNFPNIYTALTFDVNMGIGTMNYLLFQRIVTPLDMFKNIKISEYNIDNYSSDILDWLNVKRGYKKIQNIIDAIAMAYLYDINQQIKDERVVLLLATDTPRLREMTYEMPLSRIKISGRRRRLSLVRDRTYWKTYLRYFQGTPGGPITDEHYKETLELVERDKSYVDSFMRYIKDIDTYVLNDVGQVQRDRIDKITETIDIVKGILSAVEDRENLQLAFSHQWKEHESRIYLSQVNATIARRAQALMRVLKEGVVQEALQNEIDNIGQHVIGITLVLSILLKRRIKKISKSAIVRHLLRFEDQEVRRLKNIFFEADQGGDPIVLAWMRQDREKCAAHPEIFVLTAYLLNKDGERDLALQEVATGLGWAKGAERAMLFLVEAMAYLGEKEFRKAIDSCRNGLKIAPEDKSLRVLLGFSLWSAFNNELIGSEALDEAIKVTSEATYTEDVNIKAIAQSNLIYFQAEKGDMELAKKHLFQLESLVPDRSSWPALYKNSEAFILFRIAELSTNEPIKRRLDLAQRALELFKEAKNESTHYQVSRNYDRCVELINSLEGRRSVNKQMSSQETQ